jgi:deoxyadenosine/deoxycytidine kinase
MAADPTVLILTLDGIVGGGKTTLIRQLERLLGYAVVVAVEPVEEWKASGLFDEMYSAIEAIQQERAEKDRLRAEAEAEGRPYEEPEESPSEKRLKALRDGMPGLFQVYAFATRIGKFAPAYRRAEKLSRARGGAPVVLLCERSIFSDRLIFKHMLAAGGFINDVQDRAYEGCFAAWEQVVERNAPDVAVYVTTPVDAALERIRLRARAGEKVTPGYQLALHERHIELFGDANDTEKRFMGAPIVHVDGMLPFHTCDAAATAVAAQISTAIRARLAERK